jgi:hypothetical protein
MGREVVLHIERRVRFRGIEDASRDGHVCGESLSLGSRSGVKFFSESNVRLVGK